MTIRNMVINRVFEYKIIQLAQQVTHLSSLNKEENIAITFIDNKGRWIKMFNTISGGAIMIKTSKQLKDLIRNLSKKKAADAQMMMRHYMMERFLERISLSE